MIDPNVIAQLLVVVAVILAGEIGTSMIKDWSTSQNPF